MIQHLKACRQLGLELGNVNVYSQAQEMPYPCSWVNFSFRRRFRRGVSVGKLGSTWFEVRC